MTWLLTEQEQRIDRIMRSHPDWTLRHVAREAGCHHTTVMRRRNPREVSDVSRKRRETWEKRQQDEEVEGPQVVPAYMCPECSKAGLHGRTVYRPCVACAARQAREKVRV